MTYLMYKHIMRAIERDTDAYRGSTELMMLFPVCFDLWLACIAIVAMSSNGG